MEVWLPLRPDVCSVFQRVSFAEKARGYLSGRVRQKQRHRGGDVLHHHLFGTDEWVLKECRHRVLTGDCGDGGRCSSGGYSGTRNLSGGLTRGAGCARGPCVFNVIFRVAGPPPFLPRNGRGRRRGRNVGQSERSVFDLCCVQECLVLLEFYVQDGRAEHATR